MDIRAYVLNHQVYHVIRLFTMSIPQQRSNAMQIVITTFSLISLYA